MSSVSATQNSADSLAKGRVTGAVNRSSTPKPKASPTVTKATTTNIGIRHTSDGKDGKQLRGVSESVLRAGFLRKVYGLLSAQLIFTVAMASLCMLTPLIRDAFLNLARSLNGWYRLVTLIPSLLSLVALNSGAKDKYPANYVFLFLFTVGNSIQVCYVCSVFQALGYGHLVLQAAGVTTAIFLGLSAYVHYSGKDFSYFKGFLMMSLWGLCLWGLGGLLFPWMTNGLMYGFVGALIFCGFILYDTWRIQKQFGYDDYIGATIELYLDILNLFFYVLDILAKMEQNKNNKKDRKR